MYSITLGSFKIEFCTSTQLDFIKSIEIRCIFFKNNKRNLILDVFY